ncbi:MAG TPA: hypothetical protein PLI27_03475 [Ignavibacteriales bacterium]|nr:hypothetical protein [Ignavibacteriales bacterium]HRR18660.1 hypothetical protein [Ignavibacteriales bacterium]
MKQLFLSMIVSIILTVSLFAQGVYQITGSETWSTNKQFNVPVYDNNK